MTFQAELRGGLEDLEYVIGRDIVLEPRSANGQLSQLPTLAAELVSSKPDVIVALYTPRALAAKAAAREIPTIVVSGDPLGTGLVTSLARPGENITGLSQLAAESHGKCVELLRELLPSTRRIAAIWNGADPSFAKALLEEARRVGASTGIEVHPVVEVRRPEELEASFVRIAEERAEAAVPQGSLPPAPVAKLALAHRIPVGAVPARLRRERRSAVLRRGRASLLPTHGRIRAPDPPGGGPPLRNAGRATDQVRVNGQLENGTGDRD